MQIKPWLITAMLAAAMLAGCERPEDPVPPGPVVPPPTEPVPPAVKAPDGDPEAHLALPEEVVPASFMAIDGRLVEFPPARLRLQPRGAGTLARLFSDDPPSAIDHNYTGNSYYLEMMLDIEDARLLDRVTWRYQAPSGERVDSPNGIFLQGSRRQLQPFDVAVEFERSEDAEITIWLVGQFLLFGQRDRGLPQVVMVNATLTAEAEVK